MTTGRFKTQDECRRVQESLEGAPRVAGQPHEREALLHALGATERKHAEECAACSAALDDMVELRWMMVAAKYEEPGLRPGFTGRLMATIAAKQRELDEKELIWTSLPRLAARFAAVCMLILLVVGAWAVTAQRRSSLASTQPNQRQEGIFDGNAGSADMNDEVMASTAEDRR